jgi:hypothetical protein
MDHSKRAAQIFLFIFALPFFGAGLFALFSGLAAALSDDPQRQWLLVFPGLAFTFIGGALLTGATVGFKKMKQAEIIRGEHPTEPWLWREDWSRGRSNSKTKTSMLSAWVISVVWLLVSSPVLFVISPEQFRKDPKTLVGLLFPVAGVLMLVWAVRETMRWLEFGKTYFDMPIVPLVVGRDLRGTIQARFLNVPAKGVQLKLSCIHRTVSGSGNSRTTQEKIVWRDEKTVRPEQLSLGPIGTSIPVEFSIPADGNSTDNTDPRSTIVWLLEADADVPGVDYKDLFEIPVFRTRDTPQIPVQHQGPVSAPAHFTIVVRPGSDGGTEFYFPAARNKGFAMGTLLFSVIWGGAIAGMIYLRAPFLFPVVFGLFELLMVYITLDLLVGTSTVVLSEGVVRVRSGWLGSGTVQEIPFAQITSIQTAITAQQGGATGTPYYDIQLVTTGGKKVTLGKTVRDKQEADWLVTEMARLALAKLLAMNAAAR